MDQYLAIYTPVTELANRIDLANKNRLTLNPTIELNIFKTMLQGLDIPPVELAKLTLEGSMGNYRLVFNGQVVDIAKGVDDIRYNANLLNFLRRLHLPRTTTAQAKEVEIKSQYNQNARGLHQLMRMKNRTRIAKTITGRYGKSPRNPQELQTILNRDPNLRASFTAFLQKLRGSYVTDPAAKPYGDWVRKQYRVPRRDIVTLFHVINRHKASIGGCWAVRLDGYKCLVRVLSCDPIKGQRSYRCNPDNRCGPNKNQPCYRCLKWNASNTCTEAPPCERGKESCSTACSNHEIEVPSDTVLICIKRKFWIAAQDYMNENFTMAPGPAPPTPPDDTDEPDDEDANELEDEHEDEDEDEPENWNPPRIPLSTKLVDFFKHTWLIWLLGALVIGIVIYKNR